MAWLTPRKMRRKPGVPGRIVLLVDVSVSMIERLSEACRESRRIHRMIPGVRHVVFRDNAAEITASQLALLEQQRLRWGVYDFVTGCTTISNGLIAAGDLNPEVTLVISDGQSGGDREKCLAAARAMTGSIFSYLCGEDEFAIMRDIARIGRGDVIPQKDGFRKALQRAAESLTQPTEADMAKQRLPDLDLESDEFEFHRPEDMEIDLRQNVRLIRGTVFTEEFRAPEWHRNGGPVQQSIGVRSADVTIHEPQTVVRKGGLVGWLTQQPQTVNRGALQPAPAQAALPAPSRQTGAPLALPRPNQATFAPQIADSREIPLPQSRVPATFKRG